MEPTSTVQQTRIGRFFDASLILTIITLTAMSALTILTQPAVVWVDLIFDDAYYYLGIARNLADSGISSFLPPFETNGYQPLWLMLLTATGWMFGTGESALPLQLTMLTGAFILLFTVLSKRYYGCVWPAVLVSAGFPAVMTWGMETVMLPAFTLLFLNSPKSTTRGVAATAIFLTRLDALALVALRDVNNIFFRRENLTTISHWLFLGPIMAAYFAINWLWFGTPVPVSGLAKALGNRLGENIVPLLTFGKGILFAAPLAATLLLLATRSRGALQLRFGTEILVLSLTVAACACYYSLMSGWAIWGWYLWPVMLLAYFLILETITQLRAINPALSGAARLIALSLAAILLFSIARQAAGTLNQYRRVAMAIVTSTTQSPTFGKRNVQLASDFRNGHYKPGAFIAAGDRTGSLGFFLGNEFSFIHTEGLVGPLEYLKALRADVGAQFVDQLPVDYLVVDRERYFESENAVGIAEPVQGWSSHTGPYLLCFDHAGIVSRDNYANQARMVIDYRSRIDCPSEFTRQFSEQRARYGGVRQFALPGEFRDGIAKHAIE